MQSFKTVHQLNLREFKKKNGGIHLHKGREASKWTNESFWPRSCLEVWSWRRVSLLEKEWKGSSFWGWLGPQGLKENRPSLASHRKHPEDAVGDAADELAGALTLFSTGGSHICSEVAQSLSATPGTVAHRAPLSMAILHAGTLEWVAIPFSRGSSQPKDRTWVSCITGGFFTDRENGSPFLQKKTPQIISINSAFYPVSP